jgi:hypothetical protein
MNSLSTLDRYLLDRWKGSSGNPRTPSRRGSATPPASISGSPRQREQVVVPESVLASTEPVLDPGNELLSPVPPTPTARVTRAQPKRRLTGYPGAISATSTDTGSSSNSTATPLDSNAPENQRRRKRPRGQGRRVPPRKRHRNPEEGWMTAGFVGVLGLWSDLWTVIFGPDEEDLVNGKDGRLTAQHEDRHKGKGREDEVSASSASETETEEKDRRGRRRGGRSVDDETGGGWVDPVTRAPDDPEELLQQAAEAEMLSSNGTSVATPEKSQSAGRRSSPQLVSFQLGKQKPDSAADQTQTSSHTTSEHSPSTSSILTNSSNNARHTLPTLLPTIQSTHASGNTNILMETRRQPPADPSRHRNTKLLPAPLSVPLSATSATKRRDQLIRNTHNQHQPTLSISSIPRSLSTTPFHRPKTLILDLDETLIHSTSRPMSMQSSGIGGGSGMLGISLSGLFSGGKHQRGGGGARGEGHVVEVVLGGRSTLYHVYKRPYVDHFLKKVSRVLDCPVRMLMHVSGVFMVYPRYIHGEHARIRRSSH